jgi:RNA polymerase sigma-70 factor (ECF subfamily)
VTVAVPRWRAWLGLRDERADERSAEDPLVEALRAGDTVAIMRVYDQHQGRVRAFARRLTGDDDAADDLVQDVFVALPRAVQSFRGEASLGSFLISIAVNRAHTHVRSAIRRRRAMERLALEPETHANAHTDPERALSQGQLAEKLSRALDALPIDQRVAFVLCEVEERTSTEVSRMLGVPEGTVRTRVFHARKKLRERLEAEGVRG